MICKWCGSTKKASERICPACGRESPALSDCGGFYDIVPQATRVDTFTQIDAAEKSEDGPSISQNKKSYATHFFITLAALLLLLIASFVVFFSFDARISELMRQNQTPELSETEAAFRVAFSENGNSCACNLQKSCAFSYFLSDEQNNLARCYLDETLLWEAEMSAVKGDTREYHFFCDVREERLGEIKDVQFIWMIRSAEDEAWTELNPCNGVEISVDSEHTESTLALSDVWIREHLTEDAIELLCVIRYYTSNGGVLCIEFQISDA